MNSGRVFKRSFHWINRPSSNECDSSAQGRHARRRPGQSMAGAHIFSDRKNQPRLFPDGDRSRLHMLQCPELLLQIASITGMIRVISVSNIGSVGIVLRTLTFRREGYHEKMFLSICSRHPFFVLRPQ